MSRKTYCFFAAHYLPHLGGVERYTKNLAQELINRGNDVIIVASQLEGQVDYVEQKNLTIVRMESIPVMDNRFPILKCTKRNKEMIKNLQNKKIDYVIVNTRFYPLCLYAVCFAKKRKIPSIVIEHGTGHFTVNNPVFDFCGHIYEHMITSLVKKKCSRFYGVSEACNQWLKHYGINASGILYNSIDLDEIQNKLEVCGNNIQTRFDYKENDFIITYTGRLIKEKGILKLVEAVKKVKKQHKNVKLCIAGDGELYSELKNIQCEGIYVLGRLDFKDIIDLLKHTDVYCLPTDYPEGLPTSVLEAIACHVYVITTKEGGSKEIICSDDYGTILKNNTVEEIEERLNYLIDHNDEQQKAVKLAYARVENLFTWKSTADKLVNIFN